MEHGNTHLIISIYYKASNSYLSSENTPTLISWLMVFMCSFLLKQKCYSTKSDGEARMLALSWKTVIKSKLNLRYICIEKKKKVKKLIHCYRGLVCSMPFCNRAAQNVDSYPYTILSLFPYRKSVPLLYHPNVPQGGCMCQLCLHRGFKESSEQPRLSGWKE